MSFGSRGVETLQPCERVLKKQSFHALFFISTRKEGKMSGEYVRNLEILLLDKGFLQDKLVIASPFHCPNDVV